MTPHSNKTPLHIDVLPTNKFKTTTVTVKFMAPLETETMTKRSLLSKLLVRATKAWPTDKAFNRQLSHLYGAYIHSSVSKFKDKHVITITLEIVNERYLKCDTPLLEEGLNFLHEVICRPLVKEEAFDAIFTAQEKSLLKKKLLAMNDNKSQISFVNLLKHMFGEHPYRFMASGIAKQIDSITAQSLYNTYRSMIEDDYCAVYVVGNVEEDKVTAQIRRHFDFDAKPLCATNATPNKVTPATPRDIIDIDEVDQAKLNLGFRFPTVFGEPGYFSLIVFNMMFGGDPSSVLFREVREKQSLAYSIHSQIDAKNGYMFVLSGVTVDKYQKAKETIINEFAKIQRGEFTDHQLALAKKILISQRHETQDRPKGIIEILNNSVLLNTPMTNEMFYEGVNEVTRADVIKLAESTKLDTIYTLTNEKGAGQ